MHRENGNNLAHKHGFQAPVLLVRTWMPLRIELRRALQRDSRNGSCAGTKPAEIIVAASEPDGESEGASDPGYTPRSLRAYNLPE
jgi:hypothetical protein